MIDIQRFQHHMREIELRGLLLTTLIALIHAVGIAQVPDEAKVLEAADKVIQSATLPAPAPGCAVGISLDGKAVFEKAFGMAELEHRIPNTPQTIFESGSVAKQFVAASIILLELDGKLMIDDPVRKYIPELPDYGAPLTIRHMLNHTSGLRDWGAVLGITGVGRGDRVVTQDLAFDVIIHQKNVDFIPGSEYSYSNSGYTLLSTIVERVSKQSLSEFTKERLFEPLGMKDSSWRTDFTDLVPGRAQAYSGSGKGPWKLSMPIMNVYGNGGMLTTVGDWLKWNRMLETRSMGKELVEKLETNGVLNDGRKITYALGIGVGEYKGLKQISHGGSTAGYRTYLGRFPELKMSVAVLCNASSANPGGLAHRIVDSVAAEFEAAPAPKTLKSSEAELARFTGLWMNEKTHMPFRTVVKDGVLQAAGGGPLQQVESYKFTAAGGNIVLDFEDNGNERPKSAVMTRGDNIERYLAEAEWKPSKEDLAEFEGRWFSEESGAEVSVSSDGSKLIVAQRPNTKMPFMPQYKDHFTLGGRNDPVIWFTRDAAGKVTRLHAGTSRMRNMPFTRKDQ